MIVKVPAVVVSPSCRYNVPYHIMCLDFSDHIGFSLLDVHLYNMICLVTDVGLFMLPDDEEIAWRPVAVSEL